MTEDTNEYVVVSSGGIALGAFEAGALATLDAADAPLPEWLVGTSVGAVNAAIFAGNPPGQRAGRLREFWMAGASDPWPLASFLLGPPPTSGFWRRSYNLASVLGTLLRGQPGMFHPRALWTLGAGQDSGAASLYDLGPLQERLSTLLDFGRLNGGEVRYSAVATDVESGERVVFDTAAGDKISPVHVVASCAFLPLFAPLKVAGHLLGDGGLASNLALDLVLHDAPSGPRPLVCFAIELFGRRGSRPRSASATTARASDLIFGNQTERQLEAHARQTQLRGQFEALAAALPAGLRERPDIDAILLEAGMQSGVRDATILRLSYRAAPDEVGPGKLFDFSSTTLRERWQAGEQAMQAALRRLGQPDTATRLAPGLALHDIEGGAGEAADRPDSPDAPAS